MALIIKGKMPPACCFVNPETKERELCPVWYQCKLDEKYSWPNKRPEGCMLICGIPETGGDVISREAVIDTIFLEHCQDCMSYMGMKCKTCEIDKILKQIFKVPAIAKRGELK